MKTLRTMNLGLALATGLILSACGSNEDDGYYNNYGSWNEYATAAYAGCSFPNTTYLPRRVTGNFGDGSKITIDLFEEGNGSVAAVGILSIASVEAFMGTNVWSGTLDPLAYPAGGYNYAGANSQFQTCLSTNGFNGTLDNQSLYQGINLALNSPNGTFVQMGELIGFLGVAPAVIVGNQLEGYMKVVIPGYPEQVLPALRP